MHLHFKIKSHNRLTIRLLTVICLILTYLEAKPQLFSSNQNPPSVKWEQINTPNFQVIYPGTFKPEAQNLANLLEGMIERVSATLGKKPRKISIILQNQGTSSNGFVQLAPRRSEFFTTPSQSFDFQNWLNSLAIHELRHVVQFDKIGGRFTRFPFEALGLSIFGITLPSWFFEGDAVSTETALTKAGRGRIPEWSIAIRANTLSGKKFSYSKDYFGSVRDLTPGYYQLGFFMNTKLRRDYGKGITDSLLRRISGNPLRPYNFSNSVKKFTGFGTKKLHDSTISELDELWKKQLEIVRPKNYISLNRRKDQTPENFLLPVSTPTGSILYLKQSVARTPAIYEQDINGKTKKLFEIGSQEIPWFSYGGEKIVWDEFRFDARYQQRSFNVINIYNRKSKTRRQLTHHTRLFAPALSADGLTIAAIEVSLSNKISLIELSAETGKEVNRYNSPNNYMLQMPVFSPSGKTIAVLAVANQGKTIYELDRNSGKFSQLLPLTLQEIVHPFYINDQIVFKAHFNGIDNIYRVNPTSKQIYQLTSVKFGAANPSYDPLSKKLIFNNYTLQGYDISSINYAEATEGTPVSNLENASVNYADPLTAQEGGNSPLEDLSKKEYPTKRFKEINNLFYFHSIIPIREDNPYFDDSNFGLLLQSDSKLNTLSFYTAYQFNNALNKSEYEAGFSYSRFFPVLNVTYVNRPRLIRTSTLRENEIKADLSIPLISNQFNSTYRMSFNVGTSYTSRYDIENNFSGLIHHLEFPMHYELSLSKNNRRSSRDLAPKWGQNISVKYRHFPFENQVDGELFTFKSTLYFPGLARNHSFQASFNFQNGDGNYKNTVDIPRVSGYMYLAVPGKTSNTLLLDYRLPLFYPDWELGPLAYIKRFKAGLFADFDNIDQKKTFAPRSYGFDLRADMNLLRFPLPNFDLGGKVTFLNEKSKQNPIFETVVSYNF
ncbi:MAG: hypothetical protein H7Y07_09970 [Pyrinomonadaceae bacterium]|nr:hypothetical protein [Sphingobacteriaceae bacterium]